ncbi:MAG: hypothetical protein KJ732_05995 [Candidatus Margulisbacteria bacterium]|nr:hypothetical protein [Candidatus Margulisiibacteriota bacterium]
MTISGPRNIRAQGLFAGRYPVIDGRLHSRAYGLRTFLLRDAANTVYRREYPLHNGYLHLAVTLKDGKKISPIWITKEFNKFYVAVREERLENGRSRKVLYGWGKQADWGVMARARVRYIVAEKENAESEWQILHIPRALKGLTERQEVRKENDPTVEAMTQGLGKRIYRRWWNVTLGSNGDKYVKYAFEGLDILIHGFAGYDRVYSLIAEEGDRIIARFYQGPDEARQGAPLIKAVIMARKSNGNGNGNGRLWRPLLFPQVITASPNNVIQHHRATIREIKAFLLAREQETGTELMIDPRPVNQNGTVRFGIDSRSDWGGVIEIRGYKGYETVAGKIMVEGAIKKAYFWADEAVRGNGEPAIRTEGHLIAKKSVDLINKKEQWEIIWRDPIWGARRVRQASIEYGNIVFSTAGSEIHLSTWPVRIQMSNGYQQHWAVRAFRGGRRKVNLHGMSGIGEEIFSVTREFQGMIKLVEFWKQATDYVAGERPFDSRFIAFRPSGKNWMHFWARFDEIKLFKRLIQQGLLTKKELNRIVCDDYLAGNYEQKMIVLIDSLNLY